MAAPPFLSVTKSLDLWRISSSHWGAFRARTDGRKILEVRPFEGDREPSPLLASIPAAVHSPNRIASPCVRKGWLAGRDASDRTQRGREPFVPVSWDKVLALVSGELARVRERHGSRAIFNGACGWASAGCFHHARAQAARFLNCGGGHTQHLTNFSFGAGMVLLKRVIGTDAPLWGPGTSWASIAEHSKLMVCFGGLRATNVQMEAGGCADHASLSWMRRARDAGVRFVGISPLRTDMPGFLDAEWIAIAPGSDTALLLALLHELVASGRHDRDFLARCCVGFDALLRYLRGDDDGAPKSAHWAEHICGVPAARIQALAVEMAMQRTFISLGWSLQRADFGEQPYWAALSLAAALGQVGLPGGGIGFGYGSIARQGMRAPRARAPRLEAGANAVPDAVPATRAIDMLCNPGASLTFDGRTLVYPDIRLLYLCGGNPFHHHQDLNRLLEAWRNVETIVVHEPWWTASARHADIVLPATTPFERNDLACGPLDRHVVAMQRLVAPQGNARNDFDIFCDLSEMAGTREQFAAGLDEDGWLRQLYAKIDDASLPGFDEFWRRGVVELGVEEEGEEPFAAFRADPLRAPLSTPSGKIELFSEAIDRLGLADCAGHARWYAPREGGEHACFPLHLVSHQPATRLHSQLDDGPVSQASKVRDREPVLMHPADAVSRGIVSHDVVRVHNDRGACLAGVIVTDDVKPGVVVMATGARYDPLEPGVPGTLEIHGNPNVLTHDGGTSGLAQGSCAQSARVEVSKWLAPVPAMTLHRPPSFSSIQAWE